MISQSSKFLDRKKPPSMRKAAFLKTKSGEKQLSFDWSWIEHVHTATFAVESHFAIHKGEERVIAADADAEARMHLGAALTDDDVASNHGLTAEFFDAEAFAA